MALWPTWGATPQMGIATSIFTSALLNTGINGSSLLCTVSQSTSLNPAHGTIQVGRLTSIFFIRQRKIENEFRTAEPVMFSRSEGISSIASGR